MDAKVCIIGAGSTGITIAKALKDNDIPFDCFEKGSSIGGNWCYHNDNGLSSVYKSLHINSTKWVSAYPDFPMPDDYPDYPRHDLILSYLLSYVEYFKLKPFIIFNTEVVSVLPINGGSFWEIKLSNGEVKTYKAVIVANGHHWDPYIPEKHSEFTGKILHSHQYKMPYNFEDKKVLVMGMGNSAVDIAAEISPFTKKTILSTRSGAHIIPKYILGKPMVKYFSKFIAKLPLSVSRLFHHFVFWLARGSLIRYGFPKPNHKLWEAHPTVSSEIFTQIGHGDVKIKPDVDYVKGEKVIFKDGSEENIDTIIYATGYKITFPFLDKRIFAADDNEVRLYKNIVHPQYPSLFFAGLIQPNGSIMPLAHFQGVWIAKIINKKAFLPSCEEMLIDIEMNTKLMAKKYRKSLRHTIEVDHYSYQVMLEKLISKTNECAI